MDYEKMYNDALERAKKIDIDDAYASQGTIAKTIFPELAESDDERVKTWLVNYFKEVGKSWIHRDITCEQILAWLEKQKELPFVKDVVLGYPGHYFYDGERMHFCGSPVMEEKQKEQKPAESRKRNRPKESWLSEAKYEIEHADELLMQRQEELREIRELKKQEQHPSSRFLPGDWVVYDGPLGHAILQVKDVVGGRYSFVDNVSTLLVDDSDKFLRPLTPKDVEKPAEWSEEDKDMLNSCISSIEEAKENRYAYKETDGDTSYDHEIAWLKSLRPSWKPSEEQMDAIKHAYNSFPNDCPTKSNLMFLYRDLKKL